MRVQEIADDAAAKLAGGAGDKKGFGHREILILRRCGGCCWSQKETSTKIGIDPVP
jgi:hypothetical protein